MLRCFGTDSHPQFRDCVPQEPPLLPLNNSIREAETLRSMVGYFKITSRKLAISSLKKGIKMDSNQKRNDLFE